MFLDASQLVYANAPRLGGPAAVADLDGDGADEIVVAGLGCPNLVLKWAGDRLVDRADPTLADAQRRTAGVCAADADGDGREELYALNIGGPDRLFACFGNRWLDLLQQAENLAATRPAFGQAVACLDRVGHGRYGFVIANGGGPVRLYELDRRGRMHERAEEAGMELAIGVRRFANLPLVSEIMDLYAPARERQFLFRNLGDGVFEDVAGPGGLLDPALAATAVAVLDTDGAFALFCANGEGEHRFFRLKPGRFGDAAPEELAEPVPLRAAVAADFDNDGCQELLLIAHGRPNRLFRWRDDRWSRLDPGDAEEAQGWGAGAVVADVDGDGRLELLVSQGNQGAQPLRLYRPIPTDYGWLRVRPLTRAGAPARGAVVTCTAAGRVQRRAICTGGTPCQMEPVAHFGLGDARAVERVEVRWPDGLAAVIDKPEPNRLLVVPHPAV